MIETELRTQILDDIERLKEDVSEFLKDRRDNRYTGYRSGVRCPKCKKIGSKVVDTEMDEGFRVRRRECKACGKRWNTIEIVQD